MLSQRQLRRTVIRTALFVFAALLGLIAIGLSIASILLALLNVASPALATLLTALIVAAFCLLLSLFLVIDRRRSGGMLLGVGKLMPSLLGVVRRRPIGAVGAALALGVVVDLLQRENGGSNRRGSSS